MNDWPAHLHHVEQWLEGTMDYAHQMHYHGPCTYPAAFMYLYTPLYFITGGSLQGFQVRSKLDVFSCSAYLGHIGSVYVHIDIQDYQGYGFTRCLGYFACTF